MDKATWDIRLAQARKHQRNSLLLLIFTLILPFILFSTLYILDLANLLSEGFLELYTDNTLIILTISGIVNTAMIAFFITYTYRVKGLLKNIP